MNINVENFLVLKDDVELANSRLSTNDSRTKKHSYTVNGIKLYPIGNIIPLIFKGKKCKGLVIIDRLDITPTNTTVYFTVINTDGDYKALYDLYRNQLTASANEFSDDPYDDTDIIVPGAYTATRANSGKDVMDTKKKSTKSKSKGYVPEYMKGIMDDEDDRFEDDEYEIIYDKIFGKDE